MNLFKNKCKFYNLRTAVGKYVAENFGDKYVEEALRNYDTINRGGSIGGFAETVVFIDMVETVKKMCKK